MTPMLRPPTTPETPQAGFASGSASAAFPDARRVTATTTPPDLLPNTWLHHPTRATYQKPIQTLSNPYFSAKWCSRRAGDRCCSVDWCNHVFANRSEWVVVRIHVACIMGNSKFRTMSRSRLGFFRGSRLPPISSFIRIAYGLIEQDQ